MVAEHLKQKNGGFLQKRASIVLEVIIPAFSVLCLLAVTIWITSDAVNVIKQKGANNYVNVFFLFAYTIANAVVDLVSNYMFYKRRSSVFYGNIVNKDSSSNSSSVSTDSTIDNDDIDIDIDTDNEGQPISKSSGGHSLNMNMVSAFTHVGSDTLRTTSVFIAAMVASTTGVRGSLCDAWAAVAVTVTIVAFVIPLCTEISKKAYRLHHMD